MTNPCELLLLINKILILWDIMVIFFLDVPYLIQTLLSFLISTRCKVCNNCTNKTSDNVGQRNRQLHEDDRNNNLDETKLISSTTAEVKMVMDSLGIVCEQDDHSDIMFGYKDNFSALFEEEEPSLEEVGEAFGVFDQNRDGFIDAMELQRVLRCLGLGEGSKLEDCKRMINAFDENGDGLIDGNEFSKLLEKSFC